jgi:hypothetical protein
MYFACVECKLFTRKNLAITVYRKVGQIIISITVKTFQEIDEVRPEQLLRGLWGNCEEFEIKLLTYSQQFRVFLLQSLINETKKSCSQSFQFFS